MHFSKHSKGQCNSVYSFIRSDVRHQARLGLLMSTWHAGLCLMLHPAAWHWSSSPLVVCVCCWCAAASSRWLLAGWLARAPLTCVHALVRAAPCSYFIHSCCHSPPPYPCILHQHAWQVRRVPHRPVYAPTAHSSATALCCWDAHMACTPAHCKLLLLFHPRVVQAGGRSAAAPPLVAGHEQVRRCN